MIGILSKSLQWPYNVNSPGRDGHGASCHCIAPVDHPLTTLHMPSPTLPCHERVQEMYSSSDVTSILQQMRNELDKYINKVCAACRNHSS
jgi:hypothetical protein